MNRLLPGDYHARQCHGWLNHAAMNLDVRPVRAGPSLWNG